jgi:uncharacterized protein YjbJ (UPF0337 family)
MHMDTDRIKDKAQKVKGYVKDSVGSAIGKANDKLKEAVAMLKK